MTLDELRAQLAALDLPGDTLVVLAKDGEGNDFSPLDEVDAARYRADSTWSGERHSTEDEDPDAIPAVFLWPVN